MGKHVGPIKTLPRHRAPDYQDPANTIKLVDSTGKRLRTAAATLTTGAIALTPATVMGPAQSSVVEVQEVQDPITADNTIVLPVPKVEVQTMAAPVEAPAPVNEVVVVAGDTVSAIAARHGVDVNEMLRANGLGPYDLIFIGETLKLTGPPLEPVAVPPPPSAPPPPPPIQFAPNQRAQAIVQAAVAQVGQYQDCVKMVADSLATVGIFWYKWPHEYYEIGYPVTDPLPGDLIYYVNGGGGWAHIAIYIGNGQAVHGGWNGNETRVATVNVGSGPNYIRLH